MKTTILAAAAVICITTSARAEADPDPEFSISAGAGLAYEVLGLNLAARAGPYEGYLGIGVASLAPGIALGARYFLRTDGTGPFLALNLGAHADTIRIDENDSTGGRLFWTTATAGYRVAGKHFFAQAALGGGVFVSRTFWSTPPFTTGGWFFFPDACLAVGVRL